MEELGKYFVYATLLMPAIIMITIRRWITPINCNFFQDVFRFIGYSVFNFAVFSFAAKIFHLSFNKVFELGGINAFQYILFTFIFPLLLGCLLAFIDKQHLLERVALIFGLHIETNALSAWEEIFSQSICDNITITLKNSKIIKGKFAKPSRVSSSIENKDLYLTKISSIDEKNDNLPASMWIDGNDISYIEFEKFVLNSNENGIFQILKNIKNSILDILVKIYKGISEVNKKTFEIRNSIKEILDLTKTNLDLTKEILTYVKEINNNIRKGINNDN